MLDPPVVLSEELTVKAVVEKVLTFQAMLLHFEKCVPCLSSPVRLSFHLLFFACRGNETNKHSMDPFPFIFHQLRKNKQRRPVNFPCCLSVIWGLT